MYYIIIEMKIFQERLGSVDKIMNCLARYRNSTLIHILYVE